MTVTAARYANWKAPSQDGQFLVWPDADALLNDTRHNQLRLSADEATRIGNLPLAELRRRMRQWLGHPVDQPLIATGHQTELYHPGVWVKDLLTNAVADRMGGAGVHFAVDTDQPKHLAVRWPDAALPITDDLTINSAPWTALLNGPTPAHLHKLDQLLQSAIQQWNYQPMLGEFISSLRRSVLDEKPLVAMLTDAQHQLDWLLGLRHQAVLLTPLLFSGPYLLFVHHVLANAKRFAAHYNAALADYRTEVGITSPMRPMPDLRITDTEIEVPFWLDQLDTGTRARAAVHLDGDRCLLVAGKNSMLLDPLIDPESAIDRLGLFLRDHQLRLSPRALTLTAFLRLVVVDQFVHGIGGGRYDQVTDRLLANFFNIEPPPFAVATATLLFPVAVNRPRVCIPCLQMEGHRLKHRLLGDRKRDILKAIDLLPRRSVQRSLAFHNMHGALTAAAVDHPLLREWAERYEQSQHQFRQEKVLFDRELFYAMQPQDRLVELIEKVRQAV